MAGPVDLRFVIRDHGVFLAAADAPGPLAALATHLEGEAARLAPDAVVVVTSAELFPLADPSVEAFLRTLHQRLPHARWRLVSQACTGFHAALLDAATAAARRTLALFVEVPGNVHQHCLDAIGAGENGDGMWVREGCGWMLCEPRLPDRVEASQLVVLGTWILRQPPGLGGLTSLAGAVARRLRRPDGAASRGVSFQAHSRWSRELMAGVRLWQARGEPTEWLPSLEQGREHFSALKPLLELQRYAPLLEDGPLAFTTVGAGGRIGLSVVARGACPRPMMHDRWEVVRRPLRLADGLTQARAALGTLERGGDLGAFHAAIRARLRYLDRTGPAQDNEIFVWDLDQWLAGEHPAPLGERARTRGGMP